MGLGRVVLGGWPRTARFLYILVGDRTHLKKQLNDTSNLTKYIGLGWLLWLPPPSCADISISISFQTPSNFHGDSIGYRIPCDKPISPHQFYLDQCDYLKSIPKIRGSPPPSYHHAFRNSYRHSTYQSYSTDCFYFPEQLKRQTV